MSIENPGYDVAISFLSKDGNIAAAFNEKLSEGLSVFFFPRTQEDLAGTDGLESMRRPFFDDSRVMVVLYSEGWGHTPWTRVEQTAIEEACLKHGWERLFFVVLGPSAALPRWLPEVRIRFNYADYGLEQAVGAIKARVQELGGRNLLLTASKKAEMLRAEQLLLSDKAKMNSEEGLKEIVKSVRQLFAEIERHCAEINAKKTVQVKCESALGDPFSGNICVITNNAASLAVVWRQPYSNVLEGAMLIVREFAGRLLLPSQQNQFVMRQPREVQSASYLPDLSHAREYGWKNENEESEFISSVALAEKCVISFLELARKAMRGELS
jgi:hypothetical protein